MITVDVRPLLELSRAKLIEAYGHDFYRDRVCEWAYVLHLIADGRPTTEVAVRTTEGWRSLAKLWTLAAALELEDHPEIYR